VSYGEVLWGQKYRVHYGDFILSVLACIVNISFGVCLVLWLFELVLRCVGFAMCGFCDVWVCVCVGFVICVGVCVYECVL